MYNNVYNDTDILDYTKEILYDDRYIKMVSKNFPKTDEKTNNKKPKSKKDKIRREEPNTNPLKSLSNVPHGGFPPIFLCSEKPQIKERTYAKPLETISIHEIMKDRRNNAPFIKF